MHKWLLLDCHFLCYRAFHTTGQLSFNDVKTGVIFGFLRDLASLQDLHDTDRIVFCFDSKASKRREVYAPYKQKRRERFEKMDEEELAVWTEMRKQITKLRQEYLPALGFKNILVQRGHEADDLIASIVWNTLPRTGDSAVIVASDHDLYQLLGPLVTVWNPTQKKTVTQMSFMQKYGIGPERWAEVKALAGCSSDGVEGVDGVGEKTAIKFLLGNLEVKHKIHARILENVDLLQRNLPLVRLPYEGTKEFDLVPDEVTRKRWISVCEELGMGSLRNEAPIHSQRPGKIKNKNKKTKRKGFGFGEN